MRHLVIAFWTFFACFTVSFSGLWGITASGELTPDSPMASIEGISSSYVNNCVSVISGDYCESEVDIIVPGPQPLIHERYYVSSRCLSNGYVGCDHNGWVDNRRYTMSYSDSPRDKSMIGFKVNETAGAPILYSEVERQKDARIFKLNYRAKNKGLTNCSGGEISGRTDLKNSVMRFDPSSKKDWAEIESGSGRKRFYIVRYKPEKFGGPVTLYMTKETSPRGHITHYDHAVSSYCNRPYCKEVKATDSLGQTLYGSLKFGMAEIGVMSYLHTDAATFTETITCNDGRSIAVRYDRLINYFDGGWTSWTDSIFCPVEVKRPNAPTITYQYEEATARRSPLLCKKELPNNRFLITEYYVWGKNLVGNTEVNLTNDGSDLRSHRVKLQKAPVGTDETPIITHRFFYNIDIDKRAPHIPLGGSTDVYDALNGHIRYKYHQDHRLRTIEYFDHNDHLHHSEAFTWGEVGKEDVGNLLHSSFLDNTGKALYKHSYTYDAKHNLKTHRFIGDLTGNGSSEEYVKTYVHLPSNLLEQEIEPNGRRTVYTYKPGTDLTASMRICEGPRSFQREFYDYDTNGCLITKITDDGTAEHKDDLSNVTERQIIRIAPKQNAPGVGLPEIISHLALDLSTGQEILIKKVVRTYTREGWVLSEEMYDANNAFAGKTEYTFDTHGNVLVEKNALGHTIKRQYDANDNKIREEGPRPGIVSEYIYDFSNRLVSESITDGTTKLSKRHSYDYCGQEVASTDIHGNTTRHEYDAFGNCIKTILPEVIDNTGLRHIPLISQTYDAAGNVTSVTDAKGYSTHTQYNARGKPVAIKHADGTTESYRYTLEGLPAIHIGKNGAITTFTYDILGRLTKEEVSFQGEVLSTLTNSYDNAHLIASTDAAGHITRYRYDYAGRLSDCIKETEQGDVITHYEYDALGRRHKVVEAAGTEEAVAHIIEYDLIGRVVEERIEDSFGNTQRLTQYTLDEAGNRISTTVFTQAGPATTHVAYNLLNHPTLSTDPAGHATITQYNHSFYLGDGKYTLQTTTTDPLGRRVITTHNAQGLIASVETHDPFGVRCAKAEYFYDLSRNRCLAIESVISEGEKTRSYEMVWTYGPLNRLESMTEAQGHPQQKTTSYRYNEYGYKTTVVKPDSVLLEHRYDGLGRLSEYFSSDGSFHYKYTYDRAGNVVQVDDKRTGMSTCRSYDAQRQLTSETQDTGLTMTYERDAIGHPVKTVIPDGSSIRFAYEGVHLTSVVRQQINGREYAHRYVEYDLSGHLQKSEAICEVGALSYTYNILGQLEELQAPGLRFQVPVGGYDAVGNLVSYRLTDPQGIVECGFAYDALNQLTQESGVEEHEYSHDSIHNRVGKDGGRMEINALNQLEDDGRCRYSYDLNGNLIEKIDYSGEVPRVTTYTYDALDRATEVVMDCGANEKARRVRYSYDSFNRRLTRAVDEREVLTSGDDSVWSEVSFQKFLYDGQNEIGSVDKEGVVFELRVLGFGRGAEIGAAVAVELQDELYVPVHNVRGDVVALLDPDDGQAIEWSRYGAFGEEQVWRRDGDQSEEGSVRNPWKFCSKRVDPETGLVGFGRRDYDPKVGRWTTPDPAGYGDGPNLYAYVHNSPLMQIDLYGLVASGMQDSWLKSGRSWSERGSYSVKRSQTAGSVRSDRRYSDHSSRPWGGTASGSKAKAGSAPSGTASIGNIWTGFKGFVRGTCDALGLSRLAGPMDAPSQSGYVGETILNPLRRIVYDNGVDTHLNETQEVTEGLSKGSGTRIDYVHDATHGLVWDIVECIIGKLGFQTHASRILADKWREIINEMGGVNSGGKILHLAHSQGGITTWLALKQLNDLERKMIMVKTFGSGKLILNEECGGARNVISRGDTIRFVNMGRLLFSNPVVQYIEPSARCQLDHSFIPVYSKEAQATINKFLMGTNELQ